ncbi:hypothetical protein B0F90DRAFT_1814365 [Multifurca ochricompacta]|uniref:Uncharacterized protein n=1 Tax=Multifurca ochricompacta TaxID=376703 RepID=A0AAD4M9V1_9AGAM|nr:hypothetical protein B0F90DRAFT_1814365 [Multifurca ochricompacta]
MSSDIELDDLTNKAQSSQFPDTSLASVGFQPPSHREDREDFKESAVASWTWATSAILSAWSCALIFFPRTLLFAIGKSQQLLTPLESFLTLHFGLLLAFSAMGLVVNVPSIVLVPARDKDSPSHPLLVSVTSFSLLSAFLSYNITNAGGLATFYLYV